MTAASPPRLAPPRSGADQALDRRRIYVLPTRQGLAFGGVLVVLLAGGMNYNNALAYLLTFLLASLALVSLLHTYRNLAGLRVSARPAAAVFAGGTAHFPVRVDNTGGAERDGVVLSERRAAGAAVLHLALGADSHAEALLPVPAPRRGWRGLDQVTVASRAPFGIFRAWSPVAVHVRAVVYPAPAGPLPLPASRAESRDDHGHGGSGRDDFAGLREYRRGDPTRHIHWKAAARSAALPLKLFDGASAAETVLRFDDAEGDTEQRLSQLTAWVLEAESRGLRYGLSLPDGHLAPDSGPGHQDACLERLALFGLAG
jgi:uncharacterized protein (DUF58 family)